MSNTILAGIKTRLLVVCSITLATLGFLGSSAHAEIRVLAAGSDTPQATEEIFANGTLVGSVDRPGWSVYRELTTEDIVNNYDVLLIPYNTADWQYDFDWNTRLLPFLASGGGVIWEAPMTTGTAGSPLFEQLGTRYTCPDLTICWIPNTPLDVLPVSGITDGITSDFTFTTGYFPSWDSRLTPFLQANATGLGTITYGLYGEISAGRIVITQNAQDDSGSSTGTAAQVNAYNLLANKLQWVSASTQTPDPDLRFVPDLDGMSEADAIAALEGQGFVVSNVFYSVSNDDLPGNVVSQDPQPGAGALVGDAVNLFVVAPATGPEVTVPDVTNMATADAEATLNAAGLERGTLIWSSHPTVPAGNIISHNPVAGETSYEGWVVDVAESTGPNPGSVPFVKYQSQAEAETVLGAAGYVTGTITLQNHNVIPAGYVISQSPGDDASLAAGGAVDLVISAGPDGVALITVPDVAGLAQADAETTLTNAGLTVNVTTTFSDTVAAGTVISQSPTAGTDVIAGTTVDLVVSAGPAPTTISVPDVTGLSQAAAETALTNAGLVV
ncbi:MAG: PASTA domain-containing protein, partial [Gammaproteobacteria bacterium]